ncbi:Arsenical pump membrane protein [Tetrabaena socialis]|uniref:Arsenical pump membrane protein n=1 Tax=Tetrabaena socialis TaxID=47790 RepID=A0A2J8AHL4_9CHLO|nr:Arsenical pump membrane protein [Tetrabaena socialis]|eukprot:PNH12009.1 Arsenical pump membrane protein [Tetrabaena socialis]
MANVGRFPAVAALVIFCLCIVATILLVFKAVTLRVPLARHGRKPLVVQVRYYAAPVVAVCAMLACTSMTPADVGRGLLGNDQIQPYGILILFMSMAYIAGSLDATGVFAWLALKFTYMSGGRGRGWLEVFGSGLGHASTTLPAAVFLMGFLSVLLANTINNQPMTILLTRVALDQRFISRVGYGNTQKASLFALVLGSNIGAVFTLIGALAGILWSNILGLHGVRVSYLRFARVCCPVGLATLVTSLLVLWFEFAVFPHTD